MLNEGRRAFHRRCQWRRSHPSRTLSTTMTLGRRRHMPESTHWNISATEGLNVVWLWSLSAMARQCSLLRNERQQRNPCDALIVAPPWLRSYTYPVEHPVTRGIAIGEREYCVRSGLERAHGLPCGAE